MSQGVFARWDPSSCDALPHNAPAAALVNLQRGASARTSRKASRKRAMRGEFMDEYVRPRATQLHWTHGSAKLVCGQTPIPVVAESQYSDPDNCFPPGALGEGRRWNVDCVSIAHVHPGPRPGTHADIGAARDGPSHANRRIYCFFGERPSL